MKHLIFIALSSSLLIVSRCSERKNPNLLHSDEFATKAERVKSLKSNIKWPSEFEDAEFELFNVNGFSNSRMNVPGASSLDYRFAIKVKASDIDKWTEGMIKAVPDEKTLDWTKTITEKKNQWKTKSTPEFYKREKDDVLMIVYRTEGALYKRVIQN
ncbi:MAG: hypothetical protein AAF348_13335 [Bacteroidota bacterium]